MSTDKPKKTWRHNNGGGRPSKYSGEYCQMLIDHMGKEGLSYESFAGKLGVAIETLYAWERKYPRFLEAKRQGLTANLLWWEKAGNGGMLGKIPGFNSTVWAKNMANRHGWREKVETENKTTLTGTVNLNGVVVSLIEQLEGGNGSGSDDSENS